MQEPQRHRGRAGQMLGLAGALYLVAWGAGCGAEAPRAEAPRAEPARAGDALASLRYQVASRPEDVQARIALARLELEAEQPGAAFEHLSFVARGDALDADGRHLLARLHAARFEERLAAGDGDAYRDAEAALGLDPALSIAPARRAEGYFLAALAALRRGSSWGRQDAARFLDQAAALAPEDPRLASRLATRVPAQDAGSAQVLAQAPTQALIEAPGGLEVAALWLHRGGARRAALELLESYVKRGGRARVALQAWVMERAWWRGRQARPGLLLTRELVAAGVSLCPLADAPDDPGCGDTLWAVAQGAPLGGDAGGLDPEPSTELFQAIWRRAEQMFWRSEDPRHAAAWSLLALRAWLAGEGSSWAALVRARIHVDRVAGSPLIPEHAAPGILRAAGRADQARHALDRVIAAALADPGPGAGAAADPLSPGAQALIVAEAAAQERPGDVIDALRARLPGAGVVGWRAAAWAAHRQGDRARLAGLLQERPAASRSFLAWSGALGPLAWAHGRRAHALAWWSWLLSRDPRLRAGRDALQHTWREALPAPAAWRGPARSVTVPAAALVDHDDPATARALVLVAEAYAREPAVADRLARELVARAVSLGQDGPAVARLFASLGDPGRALAWWERIAAESPAHPPYLLALGLAASAAGHGERGLVHIHQAAARSGDAGATYARAAGHLLRQGKALDALSLGRQALSLTPPGRRGPVLALLATAMHGLQRTGDAAAMRAAWLAEVPARARARAEAAMRASPDARAPGAGAAPELDPAPAQHTPGAQVWGPARLALLEARASAGAPDAAEHARAVAALLAAALAAPPERAHAALDTLARVLARMGAQAEARAARAAQKALGPLLPPLAPATPPAE